MPENTITGLSLYHLDTELTSLLEYRAERLNENVPPPIEEIEAIDGEIRAYMEALPRKVDSVAHVIAHMKAQVAFAKSEIGKIAARQKQFEADIKRLEGYAAAILEKQPEPKRGTTKRLVGANATLILKGNGGLAPLVIDDAAMIPPEYCRLEGWIREDIWAWLMELGKKDRPTAYWTEPGATFGLARVLSNDLIRRGIEEAGGVPGAHVGNRGSHVEIR